MKSKLLLFYSAIVLSLASCIQNDIPDPTPPPVVTPPTPYSVVEDFESSSKTAYALDSIQLTTGKWTFNDALIGNLATDAKDGAKSVRLRTGYLAMDFDVMNLNTLYIKHAKFGNDANSTWQLLMSTDGGKTYTQLGSTINETGTVLVTDSFKVTTTAKVRFEIKKTGTTRINLDDITFKGTGDSGIIIGGTDTNPVDTTGTGSVTPGRGTPTAGADAPPVSGDNSNLLMGNPSGAQATVVTPENYLIDQHYYIESYSMSRAEPNWVSWHLDASNFTGAVTRQDNFAAFNGLPTGWYQVQNNSYTGSGFDRGHNCPSGDRTSSTDANSATFLMTNMIPQAPQNNQQTWENLESYLRTQVLSGNEVYIIMGSYGSGGVGSASSNVVTTINGGKVNVPSNVWKVAVILPTGNGDLSRVTSSTRVIAVNTPNINSINSDWKQYIVTVRDIETATGYNLLSALPQAVQDAIETKKDSGN
ncbi:DNA/RNA non-specific endonuclease [Mucilaginibacter arboris]|uniref:DNA/RNA non-specific endonuclease n=1 Tax=Mucilaginibacter arboris TaxID=2682090 RepID=A0A7K1T105_9SPHI|nr:DNA/RNA non-specific endonuclease [Mucilaginibacter arboris]MVN22970.1 DNA/RNA non-specific endonuclease [Mucilaginibacter arboris]